VRSAWIETAEDLLINWFQPVWNNEMKVCIGQRWHAQKRALAVGYHSSWPSMGDI
jgi:hypothetical protein